MGYMKKIAIAEMNRQSAIKQCVETFGENMRDVLIKNKDKDNKDGTLGFHNVDFTWLVEQKLKEEFDDVMDIYRKWSIRSVHNAEFKHELLDLANVCMMIFFRVGYYEDKSGTSV